MNKSLEKHREKIEEYAIAMEQMGLTPVASRVYAYLLFSGGEGITFEELLDYFKVSKSAISNAIKLLDTSGMIISKTRGGQRKRFFYPDMKLFFSEELVSSRMNTFLKVVTDMQKERGKDDQFNTELKNIAILYKMMLDGLVVIIQKWKNTVQQEQ